MFTSKSSSSEPKKLVITLYQPIDYKKEDDDQWVKRTRDYKILVKKYVRLDYKVCNRIIGRLMDIYSFGKYPGLYIVLEYDRTRVVVGNAFGTKHDDLTGDAEYRLLLDG